MGDSENGQGVAVLTITYVNMKVRRGEWYGRTVTVTRRHLWDFAARLPLAAAASVAKVTRQHVQKWLDDPGPRHSAAYRRVRFSAVKGFFGWLHAEGRISKNPTVGIQLPIIPESMPRAFTDDEVEQLFHVARRDPRDLVCVALAWNEGLRRAEIASVVLEDIDMRTMTMGVRGKRYRGKVSRFVSISPGTMVAISDYLTREPARTGPLVRGRVVRGSPISPSRVGEIVASVILDAGLKHYPWDGRSTHAGRHTSATQALEAGAPESLMKRFYGWESDNTLRRYTKAAKLDLSQIHVLRAKRSHDLGYDEPDSA